MSAEREGLRERIVDIYVDVQMRSVDLDFESLLREEGREVADRILAVLDAGEREEPVAWALYGDRDLPRRAVPLYAEPPRRTRAGEHLAVEPIQMVRHRLDDSVPIDFAEALGLRSLLDHALSLLQTTPAEPPRRASEPTEAETVDDWPEPESPHGFRAAIDGRCYWCGRDVIDDIHTPGGTE